MTLQDEEKKELRSQRHDFIKEYYKMASLDLDRHLKGGWQAILVLAGGAAMLTAGHDGKIGLPIAASLALVTAIWGILTVIDANYWSLRAIGFLSNVEAIYFAKEDRKNFNPYVGSHPPYKLLDSLKYLFWLYVAFGVLTLGDLIWTLVQFFPTVPAIWTKLVAIDAIRFTFWSLPFLVAVWGIFWVVKARGDRLGNYLTFSANSPGPGVRLDLHVGRHVDLSPVEGGSTPAIEADLHASAHAELGRQRENAEQWTRAAFALAFCVSAAIAVVAAMKVAGLG